MVTAVLGIGNTLRSDDGAGPYLCSLLKKYDEIISFDCASAPENFTGAVRKLNPDLLIIADAALMGLSAGDYRIIPNDKIEDTAIGTHSLSLSHLVNYLSDCAGRVVVIGIEPQNLDFSENISDKVRSSVIELSIKIAEDNLDLIRNL
ncbi:MAG TPA: hydrogenase maturation peptidase HycI [Methanocorpusculum sp.]|nr:hydrogenase maturation peptidase HycI [Methanocorpusculum sp.]